jgi:hypothetical protein
MAAPQDLCPDSWPLVSCQPSGGCPHLVNLNPTLRTAIETAAVEYLWRWSGRRFGLCSVVIRPCSEECWTGAPNAWQGPWRGAPATGFYPYIRNGNWYNLVCGRCNNQRCGCDEISTIVLPGPVYDVTEVLIDGELLDRASYRLDSTGLVRIDGGVWPRCQDMSKPAEPDESPGESPATEDFTDTFQVTYQRGIPVPQGGQLAAGTLACELAKQACNDKTCRLPKRATMVVREGVTVQMPSDAAFFATGATGIFEIDSWLASVQHDNRAGFAVHSPDVKKFRTTW